LEVIELLHQGSCGFPLENQRSFDIAPASFPFTAIRMELNNSHGSII
jgi:hypothetical protein